MGKKDQRPDIESLLSERARVEAWLDQVAAKASTMPSHVVERVRADYDARLSKVVTDLLSRADELRAETAALQERIGILADELAVRRDARAEDELRALVGEYDEAAWRVKAAEHDSGIGRLETERTERQAEHSRMYELVAQATRAPRASQSVESQVEPLPDSPDRAAPMAAEEVASSPSVVGAEAPRRESGASAADRTAGAPFGRVSSPVSTARPSGLFTPPTSMPSQPATTKRPSPFDEIGFLRTVVGRVTPFPKADVPVLPPEPDAPVPPAEKSAASRTETRRSAERSSISSFEAPPIPDVPAATPARASAPAMPAFIDEPPASASEESGGARASTGADDAARSLKCQECGWMNYPTEWYCEKCGGELAAF